jgi:hypothetical protein
MLAIAPRLARCVMHCPVRVRVGERVVLEHDDACDQIQVLTMQFGKQGGEILNKRRMFPELSGRAGGVARRTAVRREAAVVLYVDHERIDRSGLGQADRFVAQRCAGDAED